MVATRSTIRRYGSGVLRDRAEAVDPADPKTAALLDAMWNLLESDGGVGLSAPQVGRSVRVLVVRDPNKPSGSQRLDLINPDIVETFGPRVGFEEGCLSFPGVYFTVHRPKGVEIEYTSVQDPATRLRLRDDGLAARIIQHEMDHLEGVLFIDHLPLFRRLMLAPRLFIVWVGRLLTQKRKVTT